MDLCDQEWKLAVYYSVYTTIQHLIANDAAGLEPDGFVEDMKKKGIRVPGIGHRIKSKVSTAKPQSTGLPVSLAD